MTTHLSPEELIDAADRALPDDRLRHLDACDVCRADVAGLTALLAEVRDARDEREPSPLFWPHFAARVRRATAGLEPRGLHVRWLPGWRFAMAAAVMAAAAWTAVWSTRPDVGALPEPPAVLIAEAPVPVPFPAPAGRGAVEVPAGQPGAVRNGADDPWRRVVELSSTLRAEDAEVVALTSLETAPEIDDLNERQLREFLRLLRAESGGM